MVIYTKVVVDVNTYLVPNFISSHGVPSEQSYNHMALYLDSTSKNIY